ncbi:MAG: hypothetical protein IPQ05_15090 [Leptospiraceae bacterium]|nr:hypothetical protein [Leptospiraceae bacterium]MBK7053596.1 hypothetical protein [Leptospiraceae bacterium]MBK9500276.1 hypothetical protein [Leptospiraceae bacterium]MBL0265146.1 hypothetical protein [Leptospiraceae bacterium]
MNLLSNIKAKIFLFLKNIHFTDIILDSEQVIIHYIEGTNEPMGILCCSFIATNPNYISKEYYVIKTLLKSLCVSVPRWQSCIRKISILATKVNCILT